MNRLIARQIDIIQYLQKDNFSVSIETLGLVMNASSKTIKNDIELINKEIDNMGAHIVKNSGLVELIISDTKKFESQIAQTYANFCDSFFLSQANGQYIFLLKEILFAKTGLSQSSLTRKMFLSNTSFYKLSKRIQDDCQTYDIEWLSKKKEGILVKGDESKKREFFISKAYEFCRNYPNYIYYELIYYILPYYKRVRSAALEVLSYHKYYISDNSFEILCLYISFAIERIINDFEIESKTSISNAAIKHKRTSHIVKDIINYFVEENNLIINKSEYDYITMLIISNTELLYPFKSNDKAILIVEDFFKMIRTKYFLDFSKDPALTDLLSSQLSFALEKKVNVDSKGLSIDALKKISPYEHILAYSFYTFLKNKWKIKLTKSERSSVAIIFASYLVNRNPLMRNKKYLFVTSHNSSISILLREYLRRNINETIILDVIGTSEIFNKHNFADYAVILTTEYEFYKKNTDSIYISDIYRDIYSSDFYEKVLLNIYGLRNPRDLLDSFDEDKFIILDKKECENIANVTKQEYIDFIYKKFKLKVDDIAYINSPVMAFNCFNNDKSLKIYTIVHDSPAIIDELHSINVTFVFTYNPKIFNMMSVYKIYNFILTNYNKIIENKTRSSLLEEVTNQIDRLS